MLTNKIVKAETIKQDDTSCFGRTYKSGSKHNKQAKRLASRRLRRLVKRFFGGPDGA